MMRDYNEDDESYDDCDDGIGDECKSAPKGVKRKLQVYH